MKQTHLLTHGEAGTSWYTPWETKTLEGAIFVISGYLSNAGAGKHHFRILPLTCQHQWACPTKNATHPCI